MESYAIYAHITMSAQTAVRAKNEKEAEELALQELNELAQNHSRNMALQFREDVSKIEITEVVELPF